VIKPRLQSTKLITLQKNDVHSEGVVDITVLNPPAARIVDVRIGVASTDLYGIRMIRNGRYAVGFKDQYIDNMGKGGKLRLDVYFEGSATPVGHSVKVVLRE